MILFLLYSQTQVAKFLVFNIFIKISFLKINKTKFVTIFFFHLWMQVLLELFQLLQILVTTK